MQPATRQWFSAAILTLALVLLIDLAVGGDHDAFFILFLGGVLGAVCFFYLLFPRSWFFTIALADFLAVYACIFVFLTETNFQGVSAWSVQLGFVLPIVFFLAGVWWQRRAIKDIVTGQPRRARPRFSHTFVWLFPILVIGAATFVVPGLALAAPTLDGVFLAAMAAIALLFMLVSRSVCTFLLDTGLLFEEFFQQISRLLIPAFAFFTFYSLIVIVFACLFRIIGRFSTEVHFNLNGTPHDLSFSDSLYFSLISLSTVGYGDIEPVSNLVRVIVGLEIICGVLLLLFGFSEILRYARDRENRRSGA